MEVKHTTISAQDEMEYLFNIVMTACLEVYPTIEAQSAAIEMAKTHFKVDFNSYINESHKLGKDITKNVILPIIHTGANIMATPILIGTSPIAATAPIAVPVGVPIIVPHGVPIVVPAGVPLVVSKVVPPGVPVVPVVPATPIVVPTEVPIVVAAGVPIIVPTGVPIIVAPAVL
jgi:hypothetical protein